MKVSSMLLFVSQHIFLHIVLGINKKKNSIFIYYICTYCFNRLIKLINIHILLL